MSYSERGGENRTLRQKITVLPRRQIQSRQLTNIARKQLRCMHQNCYQGFFFAMQSAFKILHMSVWRQSNVGWTFDLVLAYLLGSGVCLGPEEATLPYSGFDSGRLRLNYPGSSGLCHEVFLLQQLRYTPCVRLSWISWHGTSEKDRIK